MKVIKVDKPMPPKIKKAIEAKKQWVKDVQSGNIKVDTNTLVIQLEE